MDTYDWYGACAILTNYTSVSPFECPASSKVSWRNHQIKANYQILGVASLARWFQGVTWLCFFCRLHDGASFGHHSGDSVSVKTICGFISCRE
jgi:hypothetical protein